MKPLPDSASVNAASMERQANKAAVRSADPRVLAFKSNEKVLFWLGNTGIDTTAETFSCCFSGLLDLKSTSFA